MKSDIDFPRAKELFFAGDTFSLTGKGTFAGTFHLFKELMPNGQQRTGRELKGQFHTDVLGVNRYRFTDVRGDVRWTPEVLAVTDSRANVYGGAAQFSYRMAPLNQKGVTPTASFKTDYDGVELLVLSDLWQIDGITLAGRISGSQLLKWPIRRYRDHTGGGSVRFTPADESVLMSRDMPLDRIAARGARGVDAGPFSPLTPIDPVPVGGEIVYQVRSRVDRHQAEPHRDRVHVRRSARPHEIRRGVGSAVSRLQCRLAGKRPSVRRCADRVRIEDESDSDWRLRHVRRRNDRGVQDSAHRGRLQPASRCGPGMWSGDRCAARR